MTSMIEPPADPSTLLINDAIYWRGLFIHRYAGIEYGLADLLVRATSVSPYGTIGPLPFHHNSRLKRIREIMAMDGPWDSWRARLDYFISEFETLEETRHFLVHGILGRNPNAKDPEGLVVRMYDYKGKPAELLDGFFLVTLTELKRYASNLQPTSTGFLKLCAEIGRKFPKVSNAIPEQ